MATAVLVDPAQLRRAVRHQRARREALRTARHLRRQAAQVEHAGRDRRHGTVLGDHRHLAALLRNGAWAVEDLCDMHPREER